MHTGILPPGLALDIDETLCYTAHLWTKFVIEKFGNPENLTVDELVKKYRYANRAPYWNTEEVHKFLEEKRHDDSLHEDLPIIENSNNIVQQIDNIAQVSCYITARPVSVINGTKIWLNKHGFPNKPVICKPLEIPFADGNKWKAEFLASQKQISGIVDDNPRLIEYLPDNYHGTIFLYDNISFDHDRAFIIITCKTWDDVFQAVQTIFSKTEKKY